jgi:signal transduction histidine kinase
LLIERMLDLSRIEAGAPELSAEPVDLSAILEQVGQDVTPQAQAKGLELRVDQPGDGPIVLGDPMRIRQILLNLASNAVKFTERGSVHISAQANGDGVDVTVRDTGIGIADEALPYIFEEFRQADNGAMRRYEGAGLGLAISRRLAEQMGGSISVTSRPGEGSTFTLHLDRGSAAGGRRPEEDGKSGWRTEGGSRT